MNDPDRRDFILMMTGALLAPLVGFGSGRDLNSSEAMYGLIGKMTALEGKRDALIAILLEGTADMPGCLSYVVAKDLEDGNAIWISEVWESKSHHEASLSLPAVREAISRGRSLIAGFGERFETEPVGGHGLVPDAKP